MLFACADEVPTHQQDSTSNIQQQTIREPEEVDDSLCASLNPRISRSSITEPSVNVGDVVDAGADLALRDRHGNTACDMLNEYLSDPEVRQQICKDG